MFNKNKIKAVVKFNDGEAYVFNHARKLVYTKYTDVIIGTDGLMVACYFYESPTKYAEAFGGRKFHIELSDGTIEHCHGQWWDGVKTHTLDILKDKIIPVTYECVNDLKNCYVYSGGYAMANKLIKLRKKYKKNIYGYWEYEGIIKNRKK